MYSIHHLRYNNSELGKVYEHQTNTTITSSFMNLAFTPKVKSLVEPTFSKYCKVGFNSINN